MSNVLKTDILNDYLSSELSCITLRTVYVMKKGHRAV